MKKVNYALAAALCAASVFAVSCGNEKLPEESPAAVETSAAVTTEAVTTAKTTAKTSAVTKAAKTTAVVTTKATAATEPKADAGLKNEQSTSSSEGSNEGSSDAPLVVIDPNMGQEQQAPIDNGGNSGGEVSQAPAYDEDIKNKLGIEVQLSGSNEQQAQQYYDACKAAYPSLPWVNDGVAAGVDVSSLRSETSIDVWSMSEEEVDALINERLAGRDYHDLSIEELYSLQDITERTAFGNEIYNYFMSLTHKDFNNGGYHIMQ